VENPVIGYANACVVLCKDCAPKTAGRRPHLWVPIRLADKDADDECSDCEHVLNAGKETASAGKTRRTK
jgi:hypothetical protein